MLRQELGRIFDKVQDTSACHQKWIRVLTDLYKKTPVAEFLSLMLEFLQIIVQQTNENSVYTKRALNFFSLFCVHISLIEEKDDKPHDFLAAVVERALKWSCLESYDLRYNACYFISTMLKDIGDSVQVEISLIDEIQKVMLERMQEPKTAIRLAAMAALVRLQDPESHNCPVINAFLEAMFCINSIVRKEATLRIAPSRLTLGKIKDRIRDADPSVREVAFQKCADIGPLNFRIADKYMILLCGFKETNAKVKNAFLGYLLPKWLTAYNGNYMKFVQALKLVADEEDINNMVFIVTELIKAFYNKHPIDDLISVLPINSEKLIDVENIAYDITLFWRVLVSILRSDNLEEHLDNILPEMTPFSRYIDNFIKDKSKERMDEWKFFEYQFDVMNLLEIVDNYDFSDEFGRRTLQRITHFILQNNQFKTKIITKIVALAHKCSSNVEFFINDMCQIISDVREPSVEQALPDDELRDLRFKEAELKVKINILEEKQNAAIIGRDYMLAQQLDNELKESRNKLETIFDRNQPKVVRVTKWSDEILCHCLDIMTGVLELPAVNKMTPSLVSFKDDFLLKLINHQSPEVYWRFLKCLSLYCVIDRATAESYGKVICYLVAAYGLTANDNAMSLIVSMYGVSDLISLYGIGIICERDDVSNTAFSQTKRKLYNNVSEEDGSTAKITLSSVYENFLAMLDDERKEIRHKAVYSMAALLKDHPMTSALFSRILLKWYNPVTERDDGRLQVYLGLLIEKYMKFQKEVVMEAIVPTLSQIVNVPKNSPLLEVNVNGAVLFFAEFINIEFNKDDVRTFALDVCMKLTENTNDPILSYLIKLLCHLDIRATNSDSMTELIELAETVMEDTTSRYSRRSMEKFVSKLKKIESSAKTAAAESAVTNRSVEETLPRICEEGGETTSDERVQTNNETVQTNNETVQTSNNEAIQTTSDEREQTICEEGVRTSFDRVARTSDESAERINEEAVHQRSEETVQAMNVLREKQVDNASNVYMRPPQIKRSKHSSNKACIVRLERLNLRGNGFRTTLKPVDTATRIEIPPPTTPPFNTSSHSHRKNIVISETSDSDNDNDSLTRRSKRCRKKRILFDI